MLRGQYGCLVVNAPTANTVAAAEHGIALIAALSRNVAQADASVKAGRWERSKYVGVSIVGKTLAIMGFGKVRCLQAQSMPAFSTASNEAECGFYTWAMGVLQHLVDAPLPAER